MDLHGEWREPRPDTYFAARANSTASSDLHSMADSVTYAVPVS
jgi:hypothetical protein